MTLTDVYRQLDIGASASRVWSVLCDIDRYGQWNPWIVEARGRVFEGATLDLVVATPDREPRTVQVVVDKLAPIATAVLHLDWDCVDGRRTRHEYRLEPTRAGTRFHQTHGLASLQSDEMETFCDRTRLAFDMMAEALKGRAER
jgi:Polyketide cyclase / dehydrase and lipid transport